MLRSAMISGAVLRAQSDERLVALAASGSEAAFEAIVQRYRRMLLAYCRRLLLADTRAEDVVQSAFLSAWSSLRRGTEVRELRAWLYRITHNHAVSMLRRPGYDLAELQESISGVEAPDVDLERRTLMRETLASIAALPEMQREAILRTAIDGRSYEEVAAALGITHQAVRGLVHRARCTLRSAVAAAAPAPLVVWAAGQVRRSGSLAQWLEASLAGGGTAGGAAVVLKSAAVIASSAAVVGGGMSGALGPARPAFHRTLTAPAVTGQAATRHATPGTAAQPPSGPAGATATATTTPSRRCCSLGSPATQTATQWTTGAPDRGVPTLGKTSVSPARAPLAHGTALLADSSQPERTTNAWSGSVMGPAWSRSAAGGAPTGGRGAVTTAPRATGASPSPLSMH